VDLGMEPHQIALILAELPSASVSLDELKDIVSRDSLSFTDMVRTQRHNLLFFFAIFVVVLFMLASIGLSFSFDMLIFNIVLLLVILLVMYFKATRGAAKKQVDDLLTSKMQAAMFKISTMVTMVFFFGLTYFGVMRQCSVGKVECANRAVPICANTGLPPLTETCPATCTADPTTQEPKIICPDEHIPGSRVEVRSTKQLSGPWLPADAIAEFAPVTPGRCSSDGSVGYLCDDGFLYVYVTNGDRFDVTDVMAKISISPAQVVVADHDDKNCANGAYSQLAVNFAENPYVVVPSHSTGKSVYWLCYNMLPGGPWMRVQGKSSATTTTPVYLIAGQPASCSGFDCSGSDFTPSFRSDHSFVDSMYFATVVHSTLGFGDITPITQRGMLIVVLQCLLVLSLSFF